MIQTNSTTNDMAVINQLEKSLEMQELKGYFISKNIEVFNIHGYLVRPLIAKFEGDLKPVKELIELFGYKTEVGIDNTISILPISKDVLALRF